MLDRYKFLQRKSRQFWPWNAIKGYWNFLLYRSFFQ